MKVNADGWWMVGPKSFRLGYTSLNVKAKAKLDVCAYTKSQ
jgi:hypothetical protein